MTTQKISGHLTQYGFVYGPATVERFCSDDAKGWVALGIKTKRHPAGVQIYVTKSGFVSVNGKRVKP